MCCGCHVGLPSTRGRLICGYGTPAQRLLGRLCSWPEAQWRQLSLLLPSFLTDQCGWQYYYSPMKGTAERCLSDPVVDRERALDLQQDPKTRAENLMVIDMARSDVARVCQPGSVTVPAG
ncbi:MAG: chorismate-binding protein [Lawsonella clevelandensis]